MRRGVRTAAVCAALAFPAPPRAQPQEPDDPVVGRVALEFLGGGLTATVGIVGGAFVGCGLAGGDGFDCLGGAALGAIVGGALAHPLGVWLGGKILGGNGTYLASLLGQLLGWVASVPVFALLADAEVELEADVAFVTVFSLPVVGAIAGYELSHDPDEVEE